MGDYKDNVADLHGFLVECHLHLACQQLICLHACLRRTPRLRSLPDLTPFATFSSLPTFTPTPCRTWRSPIGRPCHICHALADSPCYIYQAAINSPCFT